MRELLSGRSGARRGRRRCGPSAFWLGRTGLRHVQPDADGHDVAVRSQKIADKTLKSAGDEVYHK